MYYFRLLTTFFDLTQVKYLTVKALDEKTDTSTSSTETTKIIIVDKDAETLM